VITLLRFSRPHTVLGTVLSVAGLATIAAATGTASVGRIVGVPWMSVVAALCAALAANIYIVGLNQIRDVEIDRINKPDLPLPSNALSMPTARLVVAGAAGTSVVCGALGGAWLLTTVLVGMAIGSAYSLPPLHFKRNAILAALAIGFVRGPLVNIGVYQHFAQSMGLQAATPPAAVWFLALLMFLYGAVIAVAKDVPDVAGDRRHGIASLAVVCGPQTAHRVSVAVAATALAAGALLAVGVVPGVAGWLLALAHGALFVALWGSGYRLNAADTGQAQTYYRRVWLVFYAAYIAIPAAVFGAALRLAFE
jgi:homogentisate phytyltransferase / homogentisate geranylgeranyltransferase